MQGIRRDTDVKNRLLDSVGEGKGAMFGENSTETCTLSRVKYMTSASLMDEARHSQPVLWDNLEGWDEDRGGRVFQNGGTHIYLWLTRVNIWQKLSQYCKVFILQSK